MYIRAISSHMFNILQPLRFSDSYFLPHVCAHAHTYTHTCTGAAWKAGLGPSVKLWASLSLYRIFLRCRGFVSVYVTYSHQKKGNHQIDLKKWGILECFVITLEMLTITYCFTNGSLFSSWCIHSFWTDITVRYSIEN